MGPPRQARELPRAAKSAEQTADGRSGARLRLPGRRPCPVEQRGDVAIGTEDADVERSTGDANVGDVVLVEVAADPADAPRAAVDGHAVRTRWCAVLGESRRVAGRSRAATPARGL